MSDIVAFISARLGEDQAAAEAWDEAERTWQQAGPRNLRYDNGSGERIQSIDIGGGQGLLNEQIWVKHDYDGERTAHIARHDPARVLREVAAKRRVLERHRPPEEPSREHWFCVGWDVNDCPELRAMASVYDEHPDFDPEWRAEA